MQKAVSFSCHLKVSPESGISPAGCFSLPWRSKTRLCLVFINDYNLPLKTKFCQTQSWGIATTLMNCDGLVGLRQDAKAQSLSGWTLHDSSAVNLGKDLTDATQNWRAEGPMFLESEYQTFRSCISGIHSVAAGKKAELKRWLERR